MIENKRIIPKLEIKNKNLIKGVQFEGLRIIGDPVLYAKEFFEKSADQIIINDIVASLYSRESIFSTIDKMTNDVFVPITAGGGIRSIDDIKNFLEAGADRVFLNTYALENPEFIKNISNLFGKQFITISIEVKKIKNEYYCMKNHGRDNSGYLFEKWIDIIKEYDVGEIQILSIDNDGMENGFDNELLDSILNLKINCPIILGGGINSNEVCNDILKNPEISGVSISTALYNKQINIPKLKNYLKKNKINVNQI